MCSYQQAENMHANVDLTPLLIAQYNYFRYNGVFPKDTYISVLVQNTRDDDSDYPWIFFNKGGSIMFDTIANLDDLPPKDLYTACLIYKEYLEPRDVPKSMWIQHNVNW